MSNPGNQNEALREARHEAAHAAVAIVVEIGVDFVTNQLVAIDGRSCKGFCAFPKRLNADLVSDPGKWLDRFAIAILAGRVSDELFLKGQVPEEVRGSWFGDSDIMMSRVNDLRHFQTWQECK